MAAAAAQKNPAEDGDVVERADRCATPRTTRAGEDDRFVTRQAGDADVEEAAEGEAEEDGEEGGEQGQWRGSGTTVIE